MRPLYEPTREAAAKIVASHRGDYGKVGGWIYNQQGRPIVQGWHAYGGRLEQAGILAEREVTDPRTRRRVIRWALNWGRVPHRRYGAGIPRG